LKFKLCSFNSRFVDSGDILGDGKTEIVGIRSLKLKVLNKHIQNLYDKTPISRAKKRNSREETLTIGDVPLFLKVTDVNGDKKDEILLFRADGIAMAIDFKGKEIWNFIFPDVFKKILKGDVYGDGKNEIIILLRDGELLIAKVDKRKMRLKKILGDIPIETIYLSDINRDSTDEIIIGTKDSRLVIFHLPRKKILAEDQLPDGELVINIACGDIDGDGEREIVFGTDGGKLYYYKLSKKERKFLMEIQGIITLFVMDINNDHIDEIVLANESGKLVIFNMKNKFFEKKEVRELIIDLDNDDIEEYIQSYWREIVIYKNEKLIWKKTTNGWITALHVRDITGDGSCELIYGTSDKLLTVIDSNGNELWSFELIDPPYIIISEDLDADGKTEILVIGRDCYYLFKGEE